MNMQNEWESEERLAAAADLPALDRARREELFAATTRVIRGRRRWRAGAQLAAIILAFVAGMITMNQIGDRTEREQPPQQTAAIAEPQNAEATPSSSDVVLFDDPEAFARVYDAANTEERRRLLKEAGDYALNEREDLREALGYYQQWLHESDPPMRTKFDGSDTWLLASLKQDQ